MTGIKRSKWCLVTYEPDVSPRLRSRLVAGTNLTREVVYRLFIRDYCLLIFDSSVRLR